MAAQIQVEDFRGRRIYRNLLDRVVHENSFSAIQEEFCHYLFGELAPILLQKYGNSCMTACTDQKFREENFIPQGQIRRQKNSRECKVFLKAGTTDFYLSRVMRSLIHENPLFVSALSPFYSMQPLSYSRVMDQLIVKPKGSEESYVQFDCDLQEVLTAQGSSNNPHHFFNIFCIAAPFLCQTEGSVNHGGISILENYDQYFDFFKKEFGHGGSFVLEKQPLHQKDHTQFKNFNLGKFNQRIKDHFGSNAPFLEWKDLKLQPGDFAVIDCRIPYKIHRNQKDQPAVYTTVSLEPTQKTFHFSSKEGTTYRMFNEGKVGNWNSSTYKSTNYDEWNWRRVRNDQYSLQEVVPKNKCNIESTKLYGVYGSNL